ncbi:hypothetical protein FGADI_2797 [Fusarium gaditjirri]|uniref:F-box domain-containing protein n=1 Tax=Fusarium gaditjirri TaxID=282569 RepID=A0A8H4THI1_9HYPO|nr:hypothetical protein FGADI_2797 [Fusarium gaditjirri]
METPVPTPPFFGRASHNEIFEEAKNCLSQLDSSELDSQEAYTPCSHSSKTISFQELPPSIKQSCLALLGCVFGPSYEHLISQGTKNENRLWSNLAVPAVISSLEATFGAKLDRKKLNLELIAQQVCNNTAQPFQDIDTSSQEWIDQLCGRNLRWESIGLLWSVLRRIPGSFEPIEKNKFHVLESGTANKPVLAFLRHSISLARHFTLVNVIILDLLFQKTIMESMIVGDASLVCWSSFADAISVMTYLGVHAEKLVGPYKPSLSSEHKRRLFGRVYNLDKAFVAFTGRPPLLNPRFCSTPPPLDLSDDDLLAGGAALERAVSELDSRGWNLRGGVYPSSICRAGYLMAVILNEIIDIGLGSGSNATVETIRNLKQRQLNVIDELPRCLVYDPNDPTEIPLPRAEIRSYDKDLSDPPVETNAVSLRIFIWLTHLQNMFLLERLLLQYGCPDEGDVLLVSYEMITLTLMFWMHKDRFRDIRRDMEWLLMAFAVPGGGILCLELLSPTFQGKHPKDNRLSRSSIVQQLSLLVGFLDWVHPSAPNGDLCASCKTVIQRVLDYHLNNMDPMRDVGSLNQFSSGLSAPPKGALQSITAMAETHTTPALATMPTEIVCMIAADLSDLDVKDLTLVSKRFREIFLSRFCKHLMFSGNMKKVTDSLHAYRARKTASFRHLIHRHTRFVTFEVTSFYDNLAMNAWIQGSGVTTIPIGWFLADTPSLHGVFFDIYLNNRKEARKFISFIRKGPDWDGPEHLYVNGYAEESTMGKIVGKFMAGTITGISVSPAWTGRGQYDELARNGTTLTSLRLDSGCRISSELSVLASLNNLPASRIHKDFPQLQSLNIHDGPRPPPLLRMNDRDRWYRWLLAMRENEVPIPSEIHGIEGICKLVVAYLAAHVKSLDEVCITTEYPKFYRATLADGTWEMSEESSEDPSQKYLFPNVLSQRSLFPQLDPAYSHIQLREAKQEGRINMADRTTPGLSTMPTEILFIIGSYLRDEELVGITGSSTRLRQVFLHRRYTSIEFSGSVKHVAECLIPLFSRDGDKISADMRKLIQTFTRFVTIRIHYLLPATRWPLRFAKNDLDHFGILLRSIDRLCGVKISLNFPRHRDRIAFNKALRKASLWSNGSPKPCSLTFFGNPVNSNFNAVIRRFYPGTLGAVQILEGGLNKKQYAILRDSPTAGYLKALHIDRTVNNQEARHVVPSLDQFFLREVGTYFPRLKSLVLHEDTPGLTLDCDFRTWPFGLVWFDDQAAFDRNVSGLVNALIRMPGLRRFAFTLWFVRLHGHLVPHDWEDYKGTYRPRAMVEIDNFYINKLVSPILTQVPNLVELCVSSDHPIFYRGTRRNGQVHVQRESRENLGEEDQFPSLLLDLN